MVTGLQLCLMIEVPILANVLTILAGVAYLERRRRKSLDRGRNQERR